MAIMKAHDRHMTPCTTWITIESPKKAMKMAFADREGWYS
jgi:hypothetical protein